MITKKCLECSTEFTIISKSHNNQRYCSDLCERKARGKRRSHSQYQRDWQRNNRLTLNGRGGKRIPCKKRIFQGVCELCGKPIIPPSHPMWHHWDDEHPEIGIWVDWNCHRLCEAVEHDPMSELMNKYKRFKMVATSVRV